MQKLCFRITVFVYIIICSERLYEYTINIIKQLCTISQVNSATKHSSSENEYLPGKVSIDFVFVSIESCFSDK